MSLPGIILAAGLSSRMGRAKALLPLGESTFLKTLIETFRTTCHPVIVVLGNQADSIAATLVTQPGVLTIINENFKLGMLSSLQVGLRALPEGATGAIFSLVDHPRLLAETLRAVSDEFDRSDPAVVIPRFHQKRGHPVAISAVVAQMLLDMPSDGSPKDVIRGQRADTVFVDLDDPAIVEDIDTPADYDAIR